MPVSNSKTRRHPIDLSSIASVEVRQDNGEMAQLDVAELLEIPREPLELAREARKAPGVLAYLSHYTEIAKRRYRRLQRKYEVHEAQSKAVIQRTLLAEYGSDYLTPENVAAVFYGQDDVAALDEKRETARCKADSLKALCDAYREKVWMMRNLISTTRRSNAEIE